MFVQKTSSEVKFSFIPDLYLTSNHLETQGTDDLFSFFLYQNGESEASALFRLHSADGNQWTSPKKAPFGGLDFSDTCHENNLLFLLQCVESFVRGRTGKIIRIKAAPWAYSEQMSEKLFSCYSQSGYEPVLELKNHFIKVTATAFEQRIKPAERRRLTKCYKHNFKISGNGDLPAGKIHAFIKSVRDKAGYALSMTAPELEALISFCSKDIMTFCCFDQNKLIGVTVTVRVNDSTRYNFLSASLPEYNNFSPMVMLTGAVYDHCQTEKSTVLDLGTSLDHLGTEKPELIRFKENLGAAVCKKITWQRILDTQTIPIAVKDRRTGFMADDRQHSSEINAFKSFVM